MSESEIVKLYENLSLAEEDGAVLEMSEEVGVEGLEDVDRCLVEVETVGDNTFMFIFIKEENRNRVWQRGPWHFGKSLIALEKPLGVGSISKLRFNKADFWVQIHDIPILCMNRRTAKWMAEQLGEVVEIPLESKECWGKYMRVKVRLDILKPLKRWLRPKLGKSDEITMVGLRYERLPDFYYTCGRIGHVLQECQDEDARKLALESTQTRFGSWMKAQTGEKLKSRNNSQMFGSSLKKSRSLDLFREDDREGSVSLKQGSRSVTESSMSKSTASTKMVKVTQQKTLIKDGPSGPSQIEDMCVDGLENGPSESPSELGLVGCESNPNSNFNKRALGNEFPLVSIQEASPVKINQVLSGESSVQPMQAENLISHLTPKKKTSRKWKRFAREGQQHQIFGRISSPLQRLLSASKPSKRLVKGSISSPNSAKNGGAPRKGKSPQKNKSFLSNQGIIEQSSSGVEGQGCKRKVVLDLLDGDIRDSKRGKVTT
ncbi:hypothetical protein EZV62_002332 [Acer yangbiense]|uniref:Zinc knuckle CX2CX4HX4C domain-containing protein n=1 Tax=Acer yangbiense TaxID=1000413 RepID=A0A5C7IWZ8_9ROSI|nr:hypothetical protein EZV62_002332 [Acer yangbiense]